MRNHFITTIELERIDICDLLIACIAAEQCSGAKKWMKLHEKLKAQLDRLDTQLDEIQN